MTEQESNAKLLEIGKCSLQAGSIGLGIHGVGWCVQQTQENNQPKRSVFRPGGHAFSACELMGRSFGYVSQFNNAKQLTSALEYYKRAIRYTTDRKKLSLRKNESSVLLRREEK